jgi:hypothetical protein
MVRAASLKRFLASVFNPTQVIQPSLMATASATGSAPVIVKNRPFNKRRSIFDSCRLAPRAQVKTIERVMKRESLTLRRRDAEEYL